MDESFSIHMHDALARTFTAWNFSVCKFLIKIHIRKTLQEKNYTAYHFITRNESRHAFNKHLLAYGILFILNL